MVNNTDTARTSISEQLKGFDTSRLLGIVKYNDHPAVIRAAEAELVERTDDPRKLIGWAEDGFRSLTMREAAGIKAVRLTDSPGLLVIWGQSYAVPTPVSVGAGLKMIKGAKKEDRPLLRQLHNNATVELVKLAALSALEKLAEPVPNRLATDGVLSRGTVHAPVWAVKKAPRHAMLKR